MSTLFVVSTPIGNLNDLTARAIETLRSVDVVASEDTRHTGQLLAQLSIKTSLIALHDHNERQMSSRIVERIQSGQSVALVSDAGTPLISDPGYHLVQACLEHNLPVVPIPGVSAVTTALSVSGIATDRFTFEGFLPSKDSARRATFKALEFERRTMVFFETPHRIYNSLVGLSEVLGSDRRVAVCRELTKKFEQIVSAPAGEILTQLGSGDIPAKGEFVLVVAGAQHNQSVDSDELLKALLLELSPSKAASVAAKLSPKSKSELYDRAMIIKKST